VINEKAPAGKYICKWEEFKFLPRAIEAIKKLNDAGFLVIVVHNIAAIAQGKMSERDLDNINTNLQNELKKHGAHIDAFYHCPHHWEDNCKCRKPKPGMLLKAAKDFGFDTKDAILIGDDITDIMAAQAANSKHFLLGASQTLLQAVELILSPEKYVNVNEIEKVAEKIIEKSRSKKRNLVLVGGLSKSGKNTFVNFLGFKLHDAGIKTCHVLMDDWLISIEKREPGNEDVVKKFEYSAIVSEMKTLLEKGECDHPVYDPLTRTRRSEKSIYPYTLEEGVIVLDGITSLTIKELRDIADIKVYVERDEKKRIRDVEEFYRLKKVEEKEIKDIFAKREKYEHPIIRETKKYTDFVINVFRE
jgi:D-glycero-D-manno-heptose 1,7-bisphosphate phosphatase